MRDEGVKSVTRNEELKSAGREKESRGAAQDERIGEELRAIEPDVYWSAVLARDARFDGLFVYAVRSTGVYCKPSCPSRRLRRGQVSFFASCGEAEAVGFRMARRALTRRSPPRWESRSPCAPSRAPAPRTPWRSSRRATASCAATAA
jgi:hypothetical protein